MRDPVLTAEEVLAFTDEVFPQMAGRFAIDALGPGVLVGTMSVTEADLRPGETVSGPTMFTAADCAFYLLTLAMIGREALTVTTSCTINFMRKPPIGALRVEARVLKLGRSLCVGDALVFGAGMEAAAAQASLTYAIPPRAR